MNDTSNLSQALQIKDLVWSQIPSFLENDIYFSNYKKILLFLYKCYTFLYKCCRNIGTHIS